MPTKQVPPATALFRALPAPTRPAGSAAQCARCARQPPPLAGRHLLRRLWAVPSCRATCAVWCCAHCPMSQPSGASSGAAATRHSSHLLPWRGCAQLAWSTSSLTCLLWTKKTMEGTCWPTGRFGALARVVRASRGALAPTAPPLGHRSSLLLRWVQGACLWLRRATTTAPSLRQHGVKARQLRTSCRAPSRSWRLCQTQCLMALPWWCWRCHSSTRTPPPATPFLCRMLSSQAVACACCGQVTEGSREYISQPSAHPPSCGRSTCRSSTPSRSAASVAAQSTPSRRSGTGSGALHHALASGRQRSLRSHVCRRVHPTRAL